MGVDDHAWDHSTFFEERGNGFWRADIAAKLLGAPSALFTSRFLFGSRGGFVKRPAQQRKSFLGRDGKRLIAAWGVDGRRFAEKDGFGRGGLRRGGGGRKREVILMARALPTRRTASTDRFPEKSAGLSARDWATRRGQALLHGACGLLENRHGASFVEAC